MAGTTTQFIFIKHGNDTDETIDYFNSGDTSVTNFATGGPTGTNTGIVSPISIQADLTGGFYYIIDPQLSGDGSADGQIHLGKIATPTTAPTTVYTVPDNSGPGNEFSEANAIAIDTTNHVLYLAQVVYNSTLDGLDSQTGIVAFNYDATTGALGSATPILTRGAPGTQATDADIDEVAQLSLDSAHHVLYFTDDTFGKGTFVGANETNSVKAYDTVTHVETTVVTFSSGSDTNVEFPTGYTNGTIEGVAADPTDNLVFFSTASGFAGSESLNSIYVITPTGSGQVKLTETASFDNLAPFNLTFDDVHNKLYVSYESTDPTKPGHLVEYDVNITNPGSTVGITLSNPVDIGLSLGDPSPSNVDYPVAGSLDQLPVLTISGTATHAVEQGPAVTLLAAGTTLTDADQTQLVGATVKITGGTFNSNENSTSDDHLGFDPANVNAGQVDGTSIHFSYDAASETLTLTGVDSLADYNLALSEVQYSTTGDNPTNYGGNATRTITWHVDDGAIGDPSGTNTTTTTLSIDAVNDAPVATTPGAHYAATEQVNLSLKNSGLSVSDVDGGIAGQPESVTLSVGEGILTLAAGTSGAVIDSGNGTNSVTFHGTIAQLDALLNTDGTSSVTYNDNTGTPAANTTLTLQVNDNGNTGTGGPLVGSNTATIDITAVNDAPVAVMTTNPYAATENVALDLKNTGMSVSDIDANGASETVTLSVGEGTLTLGAGTSGATIDSGNGTGSVTFHGTLAELNALLNTDGTSAVTYIDSNPNPATNTITLSINDNGHTGTGGPLVTSTSSTINVTAVDNAPVATTPGAPYAATEQTDLSLKNTGLSVSDPDVNGGNETVTLSVGEGILTLAAGTSGAVIDSGNGTNSVTFHGTIAQLNALLNTDGTSSVTYNDNTDTPAASTTLTLQVNDNGNTGTGGPLVGSNTATIDITAVNDAPVAVMTTNPYAATENVALDLKNTGMSVSDIDANGASETVTLSASEGTLTLVAGTSGATIDSGNGTGSVTFEGTLAEINALLNTDGASSVSYIDNNDNPAANALLTLTINDNGHTGTGGPLSFSVTSSVDITAVNDAPVALIATNPYDVAPNTALDLKNSGMSVSDVDGNNGVETVILSVTEGTLTLAAGTSGAVIDSGNGTDSVTFHGTIAQLDALLNTDGTSAVGYIDSSANPAASATLSLSINDGGHTGAGGPLTDTATTAITILGGGHAPGAFDFNFDANGDGHADILLQSNSSAVSIWNNGMSSAASMIADSVPGWHLAGIGDFDGNGKTDILWTTDSGRVAIWDDSVIGHTIATDVPSSWHVVGTGDFDGNGKSDILWQNDSGAVAIWDNGQIGHTVAGPGSMLPTDWHVVGTGDFDGNGKTDILWQNVTTGALTIWNNGQAAGASTIATSMPSTWHVAGIGDFDGNGRSDILWQNDNGSVAIWDNGVSGHTIATGMPSSWHITGVSDFDGNGKSDILWQNDNGSVAVWDNGQIGHTIAAAGTVPVDWHIIA